MRALTINELMRFERGLNPKAAMGIGGVDLQNAFNQILKDPIDKWEKFIVKTLVGKRVSGSFLVFRTTEHGRKWVPIENATITVKEIKSWERDGDINLVDETGDTYSIQLNKKIHIG